MKSKIAGVALAAVVGACALSGWTERAEAATIPYSGLAFYGSISGSDNANAFYPTGNPSALYGNATLVVGLDGYTNFILGNDSLFYRSGSLDGETVFTAHDTNRSKETFDLRYTADSGQKYYQVFYNVANYNTLFTNRTINISEFSTPEIDLRKSVDGFNNYHTVSTSPFSFDISISDNFGNTSSFLFDADAISVIGGPSPVPLPSSAPLFGAALLALGGATYARRRAKAA